VPIEPAVADVAPVVERAVVVPVLVIEAAPGRQVGRVEVPQVPLADDGGAVARGTEGLGQGAFGQGQAVLRPGADDADLEAVAHGVAPGQEGGAGGGADGLDVELLQADAGGGELVDVRRLDFASVVADVLPAEVVGEEEDDVRPGGGVGSCGEGEQEDKGERFHG
jgi:hypothetical protein